MRTSVEYSGCRKTSSSPQHRWKTRWTSSLPRSIHKVAQSAQKTETNRVANVGTQRCRQTQPCWTPLLDTHRQNYRFPHAADFDRESADPTYPFAVMGPPHHTHHETDTAMGAQPLIRHRPTFEKPIVIRWAKQLGVWAFPVFPREFFLIHLSNRL